MNSQLVTAYNPLNLSEKDIFVIRESISVSDLVKGHVHGDIEVSIHVNANPIDQEEWDTTFIQDGDLVTCVPILHGDSKQLLSVVALIAVAIFAPYMIGQVAALTTGGVALTSVVGALGSLNTAGLILSAAVIAGGGYLISTTIAAPERQSKSSLSNAFSFNPATTQRRGVMVAKWYGENKVYGNVIAAYTRPTGENNLQTLRTKIGLGHGPIAPQSQTTFANNVKINKQPLSNFDSVQFFYRNGVVDQEPISRFEVSKTEFTVGSVVRGPSKAVREVQKMKKDTKSSGGTFLLTYLSETTASPIPHDASTATIQTALETLSTVDSGDIVVSGKRLDQGGGTNFKFLSAEGNVSLISGDWTSTTGVVNPRIEETRVGINPSGQPILYTTPNDDFESLEVDVGFPGGLFAIRDGQIGPWQGKVEIEYKKIADGSYTSLAIGEVHSRIRSITVGGDNYPKITFNAHSTKGKLKDNITRLHKGDGVYIQDMPGMVELNGNQYTIIQTGILRTETVRGYGAPYAYWIKLDVDASAFTPWTGGGTVQAVRDVIKEQSRSNVRRTYEIPDLTKEVQTLTKDDVATGGTYTFSYNNGTGVQTTDPLAHNATISDIQEEIEKLATVELGDITVSKQPMNFSGEMKFVFAAYLGDVTIMTINNSLTGPITTASFAETIKGETSRYDVRVTKLTSEKLTKKGKSHPDYAQSLIFILVREVIDEGPFSHPYLSYVGIDALATDQLNGSLEFSCVIEGSYIRTYDGTNWGVEVSDNPAWVLFDILTQPIFTGSVGFAPTSSPPTGAFTVARYDGINPTRIDFIKFKELADFCDNLVALTSEIQTIVGDVLATGGTWRITYDGQTTGLLAFDASTAVIQTAMEGLSNLSAGDVVVSGTGVDTAGALIFTFKASLGDVALLTTNDSALTPTTILTETETVKGVTSKRITFNAGFDDESSMWENALKVCEIARCSIIFTGIDVSLAIDKADTPVQMFGVGNIIENSFNETFLSQEDRASELDVNYIDKTRDHQITQFTAVRGNVNTASVLSKLSSKATLDLKGVNTEAEANRAAMYRLRKNELLNRVITFKAEVDAIACQIGDVITFQHDVTQWGDGGRVASDSGTSSAIQIDSIVTASGGTDKVLLKLGQDPIASGSAYVDRIEERTVSSITSGGTVINVSSPFNSNPKADDVWMFGEENLSYRKYRIVGLSTNSDQQIDIAAMEYNANLYTVDDDDPLEIITTSFPDPEVKVVDDLTLAENSAVIEGSLVRSLEVSWTIPNDANWQKGEIYLKDEESENYEIVGQSSSNSFTVSSVISNHTYSVVVVSVDLGGRKSEFSTSPTLTYEVGNSVPFVPDTDNFNISGLSLLNTPNTNVFSAKDARFSWNSLSGVSNTTEPAGDSPAGFIGPNNWLKDYIVEIRDDDNDDYTLRTLRRTEHVLDNFYTYTYEKNSEDGTPSRQFTIGVFGRDALGRTSKIPTKLTVSNPVPAAPTNVVMTGFFGAYRVEWDKSNDIDILGYKVWVSTTSPVGEIDGNIVYDGPDTSKDFTQDTVDTYYAKVAAYDTFGETGLSVATEVNATTLNPVGAGGLQGWTSDIVWTSTDADTVSWTAGDLNFSDGTDVTLLAGNTGSMSASTYIYYDGTTTIKTTAVSKTAMGSGNILLGVAVNNAGGEATFQMFSGTGGEPVLLATDNLASNIITTEKIVTEAVSYGQIFRQLWLYKAPVSATPKLIVNQIWTCPSDAGGHYRAKFNFHLSDIGVAGDWAFNAWIILESSIVTKLTTPTITWRQSGNLRLDLPDGYSSDADLTSTTKWWYIQGSTAFDNYLLHPHGLNGTASDGGDHTRFLWPEYDRPFDSDTAQVPTRIALISATPDYWFWNHTFRTGGYDPGSVYDQGTLANFLHREDYLFVAGTQYHIFVTAVKVRGGAGAELGKADGYVELQHLKK